MNIVELEYKLLNAFSAELKDSTIQQKYGDRVISFPVNGNQRAYIKVSVEDQLICSVCKDELVNPEYNQKTHTTCKED